MKTIRLGIIANIGKSRVVEVLPEFLKWLNSENIPFVVASDLTGVIELKDQDTLPSERVPDEADFILSFGGDGTFLRTARIISSRQVPIIGINMGRFGYLAEVGVAQLRERIRELLAGDYRLQERTMLEGTVDAAPARQTFFGLNDIVIEKGGFPRTIRLETSIDGVYLNTFNADGLIVSTPTGSTGYSLSVGGPIIEPNVNAIIITPISPHMLANRPLVVDGNRTVEVTTHTEADQFQITADGQRALILKSGDKVTIKRAPYKTRIVLFSGHSFYALLRNKLNWRHQLNEK